MVKTKIDSGCLQYLLRCLRYEPTKVYGSLIDAIVGFRSPPGPADPPLCIVSSIQGPSGTGNPTGSYLSLVPFYIIQSMATSGNRRVLTQIESYNVPILVLRYKV